MPAYFDTGFTVREPAWHGLGAVLDEHPDNWAEARVAAGLTWDPIIVPAWLELPEERAVSAKACAKCSSTVGWHNDNGGYECAACAEVTPPTMSRWKESHKKLIVRNDTYRTLGAVSDRYELIDNAKVGEIVEALLGADANVRFESAGSIKDGENVWALARLDEPATVAGDDSTTYPYLALTNDNTGSGACTGFYTDVRIVCWNTYSMAMANAPASYVFRHAGNVNQRIEEARQAISGLRESTAQWRVVCDELYALPVNAEQLATFTFEFLPEPPADVVSPRVRKNIDDARIVFAKLYNESPTTDGHRGTALGLVDAAVEYLDHLRGYRSKDTYMGRCILRPEPLKAKALNLALAVCGA